MTRFLTTGEPGVSHGPPRVGSHNDAPRYSIREEPALEKIIRPFETPKTWPGQRRLPPEQDEQEALLKWGTNVNVLVTTLDALGVDSKVVKAIIDRDNDGSSEQEEDPDLNFYETRRITSVVRVTNPEDPASWVDVERVEQITFNSAVEGTRTYVFRNKEAPYPPVIYI